MISRRARIGARNAVTSSRAGGPVNRVLRWLFSLASAASLLLCVLACVAWGRGYVAGDLLTYAQHWAGPTRTTTRDGSWAGRDGRKTTDGRSWLAASSVGQIGLAVHGSQDLQTGQTDARSRQWETQRPPNPIVPGGSMTGVHRGRGFYYVDFTHGFGPGQTNTL